jgi:DNA-binding transcriptional ArsR family regulator
MDYLSPLEQLFPGVGASVLSVLARTTQPLTLRQVADLADASHTQVSRHIQHLERLGVVDRRVVGRAHLVSLTDSAAANMVRRITRLGDEVVAHMRETARGIDPAPESIVVFGSFARGAARADSDIDVAIVAPAGRSDDEAWLELVANWVEGVAAYAGNPVADIVVGKEHLAVRANEPLWESIRRDGILVTGRPIDQLMGGRSTVAGRSSR